jgi:hypothetical protein
METHVNKASCLESSAQLHPEAIVRAIRRNVFSVFSTSRQIVPITDGVPWQALNLLAAEFREDGDGAIIIVLSAYNGRKIMTTIDENDGGGFGLHCLVR